MRKVISIQITFLTAVFLLLATVLCVGCGSSTGSIGGTTVPPMPMGVVATAAAGQVSLSWGVSSGATSYYVSGPRPLAALILRSERPIPPVISISASLTAQSTTMWSPQ